MATHRVLSHTSPTSTRHTGIIDAPLRVTPGALMSSIPAQRVTTERIKSLLRRDLKLDPQATLADDMPLLGGPLDLDSLDVLLVITTIEKEFGIQSPLGEEAREVFRTVTTLASYLDQRAAAGHGADTAGNPFEVPASVLDCLPHREPFRWVSRVDEIQMGVAGRGGWTVTGSESFFAGHFPGRPIVPGVLLGEALAQLSGLVAWKGGTAAGDTGAAPADGRLARIEMRFHHSVTPPAEISLASRMVRTLSSLSEFEVSASVQGRTVAEGTVTLAFANSPAAMGAQP